MKLPLYAEIQVALHSGDPGPNGLEYELEELPRKQLPFNEEDYMEWHIETKVGPVEFFSVWINQLGKSHFISSNKIKCDHPVLWPGMTFRFTAKVLNDPSKDGKDRNEGEQ